ncbi:hypothetical protein J3R30DRAFT_3653478 [Lentinula aciculospora]|uniref:Clavaminate synthase-like protein n=1 Tax=Lentinula aciculospora TaxID=153920 RepID=A0A9W9AUV1_9AGAR|nr:hypothetical protein J3R30DRAFT_3653478 [Lentinula aciculospora]
MRFCQSFRDSTILQTCPDLQVPPVPRYEPAPAAQEALDYADLAIIDLRNFTTAEGRVRLVLQVREAMSNQGFFYVIGHGYPREKMERMFDIANVPFTQVSEEEKEQYMAPTKHAGSYQGYKLRQFWHIDNGQVKIYNIHRDVNKRVHPEALRPLLPESSQFARHSHPNVLDPILRWDADSETLIVGLLFSYLLDHNFTLVDFCSLVVGYMKYDLRSAEDEQKTKNVWLKGHNDIGTVTLLYNGVWKWIKHIDNAIVVNSGDAMDFLSGGGLYRATIHRVVQPPPDQHQYTRLGIFYFCMADDNVKLAPLVASPVLQRLGIERRFERDEDAPVMAEWRKARTAAYGRSNLSKSTEETDIEQEVIQGVVVKHYN